MHSVYIINNKVRIDKIIMKPSRRKITYLDKLEDVEPIILASEVCHVAMVDVNNKPYVLPFNFGYSAGVIYLHSDPEGKKIDILKNNPNVSVNFTTEHDLFHINKGIACSYGMRYKSVLIDGVVEFIENEDEKIKAFNIFMRNYIKDEKFTYSGPSIEKVCVFKIEMTKFTGKTYGY